ncbi:hypothetical protein [Desulfosarcina cetonica]|uniref:hypothetical protein n=1 Tax=Desulfosarcina cetonica TaxID=90730 RepID=UPI0012ECDD8E|nr:hypothetical protein [Desulfosarcina cetonica]
MARSPRKGRMGLVRKARGNPSNGFKNVLSYLEIHVKASASQKWWSQKELAREGAGWVEGRDG